MGKNQSYSNGVLAAICSNLEKGCGKQLKPVAATLFDQLAQYFGKSHGTVEVASLSGLIPLISADIEKNYPAVEKSASSAGDRGSLRCMTWGKKVTSIHKSLLARYEKQGDSLLEGNNLYVCEACGFIAVSSQIPDLCPICKAPSSRFVTIS
jgi:rubrerythrin